MVVVCRSRAGEDAGKRPATSCKDFTILQPVLRAEFFKEKLHPGRGEGFFARAS